MPNMDPKKCPMPSQDPNVRNKNFKEVALGYTADMAVNEAKRCLQCKNHPCRSGCPVDIDIPGFIANRLQHALYREAVYMVEQGICGPEDIDKCIRSSWGPRYTSIGLFDHFDYAGLDLIANIETYLYPDLCNDTAVQPFIQERLARGDLGYKTGVGVYDWPQRDMDDFRRRVSAPYLKTFNWKLPED